MKARILTPLVVLAALFMTSNATAQRRFMNPAYIEQDRTPHTVSLTLSRPYPQATSFGAIDVLVAIVTGGGKIFLGPFENNGHTTKRSPGISVDYRKMLNPVVSLGTSLGYTHMSTWYDDEYQTGLYCHHTRTNLLTTTFQLELTYLRRGIFTMYGLWEFGFGFRFQQQQNTPIEALHTRWQPAEQPESPPSTANRFWFKLLSHSAPLGFRFGRKCGGYLELGFGYRRWVSVGVDFQF